MASFTQPDMLSSLPDVILIIIISSLTFKEAIRTSVLSKRWRHLCHETTNISFKESEYVDHLFSDYESLRLSFVGYMYDWVTRFEGQVIESFEICFSVPTDYVPEIEILIEFAVSKKVKNLSLDFSDPIWITADAMWSDDNVQLPTCFYSLKTLESLKIYACDFNPSRIKDTGFELPRSFSVGWICLIKVQYLISKSPKLEILSIRNCWNITSIYGNMREVVCENGYFPLMNCIVDLPKVEVFKYVGRVLPHNFKRINTMMKNVCLDFVAEEEDDVPTQATQVDGEVISHWLNCLRAARTLNLSPYLLEVIQECVRPHNLLRPMQTQHLVLRTKLQPKEFKGIRLLLENCPDLITLTLDMLPSSRYLTRAAFTYNGINRQTYWLSDVPERSIPRTLKVIKMIELHIEEVSNIRTRQAAEMLCRFAHPIQVIIHNA